MSNGFGVHGGKSRCGFVLAQFYECIAEAPKGEKAPQLCTDLHQDYWECLHGAKRQALDKKLAEEREAVREAIVNFLDEKDVRDAIHAKHSAQKPAAAPAAAEGTPSASSH